MRWQFSKMPGAEEPGRKVVEKKIAAWWKAFENNHRRIDQYFTKSVEFDVTKFMHDHLQAIHPEIMWEYGPAVHGKGHRLVITVESSRHLKPLAHRILEAAPKLEGWEFYGYRLPEDYEAAVRTVQGRTGTDVSRSVFVAERGDFNRIDCTITSPLYRTEEDCENAWGGVFVALEAMLGEEKLLTWIGVIEVVPWESRKGELTHLKDLREIVDRRIDEVRESLPGTALHADDSEGKWTLFKLEPEKAEDYPHQLDMFVGKAMLDELWKNGHSSRPFYSTRYSRSGETFCYVKLDGRQAEKEAFKDKGEIEDALEEALRSRGLGRFIGGGTGLVYSYVDLAVTNMGKAAPVICDVLQKGKVSKRSWILFYDSNLEWEWIGIWKDSPPPPRDLHKDE